MKSFYLLPLFFLFSCNSQDKGLYEFDPKTIVKNKITLDEIADEIIYIPLDNRYLFPDIYDNFKLINNSIYLSARDAGILAFNRDGKMPRKIGSRGRGPGEYRFGMQFAVEKDNERTYVIDQGRKVKVYSKSGNFIRDILLDYNGPYFDDIEFINNNIFLAEYIGIGKAEYNWIIIDTLGNLISQKKNSIPEFKSTLGPGGGIYKLDNRVFYWDVYNDTIFSILPDLINKPSFLLSPGEHRLPRSPHNIGGKQQSDYMLLNNIFETNRFRVIIYYMFGKGAIVLIEKNSNKTYFIDLETESDSNGRMTNKGGFINDIDGGPKFQPVGYIEKDGQGYLTGLLDPFILKNHIDSREFLNSTPKYPEFKERLKNLANNINENDNKILVLVKLKE